MKFGIEVEFYKGQGQNDHSTAIALQQAGINCVAEGYNHETRRHWKIVYDGSCDLELVSPPLHGEAGLEEARRAIDALENTGAYIKTVRKPSV